MKSAKNVVAVLFALILVISSSAFGVNAGIYSPAEQPEAAGIYVVNEDTGLVMYEKNADERLYPASLTKIMTALLVIENISDPDSTVCTMTNTLIRQIQGTGLVVMNLLNGEQVTVAQLLHAMLLASAADATLLAAQTVAGSVEDFVAMMNSRAAELGCADTHFTNTHGMHDENHYSTPADIYKITSAAMRQPLFKQIVALTRYEMPATNKNGARILVNTNYLLSINLGGELYYSFAQGIKTGFTTPAGPCLVSVAENRGERYTVVVMKSELKKSDGTLDRNGAFRITKQLYGWLFDTYTLKSLLTTATVVKSIPVNYGSGVDEVGLVPAEEFVSMLPKNMDMSGVVLNYSVGASADAPIAKGDVLGSAEILLSGQSIGNVTLVAADDIERNELSYTMAQIGKFFSSKAVVAVVIVLAALLVGYIVLNIVINRRKRRNSVSGRGKSNRKPKRRKKSGRIFD